jgi:hypothetical protein
MAFNIDFFLDTINDVDQLIKYIDSVPDTVYDKRQNHDVLGILMKKYPHGLMKDLVWGYHDVEYDDNTGDANPVNSTQRRTLIEIGTIIYLLTDRLDDMAILMKNYCSNQYVVFDHNIAMELSQRSLYIRFVNKGAIHLDNIFSYYYSHIPRDQENDLIYLAMMKFLIDGVNSGLCEIEKAVELIYGNIRYYLHNDSIFDLIHENNALNTALLAKNTDNDDRLNNYVASSIALDKCSKKWIDNYFPNVKIKWTIFFRRGTSNDNIRRGISMMDQNNTPYLFDNYIWKIDNILVQNYSDDMIPDIIYLVDKYVNANKISVNDLVKCMFDNRCHGMKLWYEYTLQHPETQLVRLLEYYVSWEDVSQFMIILANMNILEIIDPMTLLANISKQVCQVDEIISLIQNIPNLVYQAWLVNPNICQTLIELGFNPPSLEQLSTHLVDTNNRSLMITLDYFICGSFVIGSNLDLQPYYPMPDSGFLVDDQQVYQLQLEPIHVNLYDSGCGCSTYNPLTIDDFLVIYQTYIMNRKKSA